MTHTYQLIEAKISIKVRKKNEEKNNEMLSFESFFCVSLFCSAKSRLNVPICI